MPAPPRQKDPRPEDRKKQLDHGAQSDRGGDAYRPLSSREKPPEPQAYEGEEESNQQRR